MYNDCPAYLQEYLNYMITIKNRSPLTVKNYYTDIHMFLKYLKVLRGCTEDFAEITAFDVSEEMIRSVTLEDLLSFLNFVTIERDNSPKARIRKAVSLRVFFRYLTVKKQWFGVNPAENLEMPKAKNALPKYLTLEQAQLLIGTCSEKKNWRDYRDYCIMTFFLNCGMRLSELSNINLTDVHDTIIGSEKTYFIKILGKGNKERIVYLNDACTVAYLNYLKVRPESKDKALFVSSQHQRLSNRRIQRMIEDRLKKSGLSGLGFTVHKLRHTAATLMYQNGVDVRVLKEVLGHESLDTTQIYTHVISEQVKQAINKNPLSEEKI